jgi:antitoxin MazE
MYIQEASVQIAKWGNSLAVRLPAKLVAELGLTEGDEIEIVSASPDRLEIGLKKERQVAIEELRKLRGELRSTVPTGYRFKRSDAYDED